MVIHTRRAIGRVLIAVAAGIAAASVVAARADLSGTWRNEERLPNGATERSTWRLEQRADRLTGRYEGSLREAHLDGTVHGGDITVTLSAKTLRDEPITITFKGRLVSAGRIEGTADAGKGAPFEWISVRQKD